MVRRRTDKLPWMKFEIAAWLFDTRILNDAEKATWIDLLCFLWNAPRRGQLTGHPQDLARMIGREWGDFRTILDSLVQKNVCEMSEHNGNLTLTSRRMLRDEKHRESIRKRQRNFYYRQPNANLTGENIDIRSKNKERNTKERKVVPSAPRFTKPSLEEVNSYCVERKNRVDPVKWLAYYESNGWRVGRNPMKDWRAAVRTWERNDLAPPSSGPFSQSKTDDPLLKAKLAKKTEELRRLAEKDLERIRAGKPLPVASDSSALAIPTLKTTADIP